MKVKCRECVHPAEISTASDVWKCNCAAGVSVDSGCACDATNEALGSESNPPKGATA